MALGYVIISMLGVAAVALFFSTRTRSSIGAALGTIGVLIASTVLLGLDAGAPASLPADPLTVAFVDLFRDPILWRDVVRGLVVQLGYLAVFTLAAWANFGTRTSTTDDLSRRRPWVLFGIPAPSTESRAATTTGLPGAPMRDGRGRTRILDDDVQRPR